jgi:nucleoside-diphosphate-sugar epimerase
MNILITGASGYLGGHLVPLLEQDHELTLADVRLPAVPDGRQWLELDVTGLSEVQAAVRGHDAVVHTVALVRDRAEAPLARFVDVMVKGTWNVVQACAQAGVTRLVNLSSVAAGGMPARRDRVAQVTDPPAFSGADLYYCLSKWLGEQITHAYSSAYPSLSIVNLRPGVIAGDGANPEPSSITPEGPHWFAFVDARDVARAVKQTLERTPAPRGTYCVVASRDDSLFDWSAAAHDLGFVSSHDWPEIPSNLGRA